MAAPPAVAANFYITQKSDRSWTVLDRGAIERLANGTMRVASVTIQRSITSRGADQPGYINTVGEYDCAARHSRWLSFTLYSDRGAKMMTQANPKPEWAEPAPGSEANVALAVVCQDRQLDVPAISASSIGMLVTGVFAMWAEPARQTPAAQSRR